MSRMRKAPVAATGRPGVRPLPGRLVASRLQLRTRTAYPFLLYAPETHEVDRRLPLVLFLHGVGERGADLELVKRHGPPRLVEEGRAFPFILVCPQCESDGWWQAARLLELVDAVESWLDVDPARTYATGLSMGGCGVWDLGLSYPDRFAALVPICGGGLSWRASRLKDVPVWAFHGQKDPVVPVEESLRMVDEIRRAGGNPRLTIYPETGHDAWTRTYADPALYEWLLQHRLPPPTGSLEFDADVSIK